MSDCTSPEISLDTSFDVVVEVPVQSPVISLLGSTSVVEVARNGYNIVIDGNPADEVVEVMTQTKGDKGDQGNQGERGLRGFRGVPGPEGIRGRDGPEGLRGFRGAMGGAGSQGNTGGSGPPGAIDSELLIELVQPMLNEAALIPIAEIREDIEAMPGFVLGSFLGDLAGDDITEMTWSAGEDDSHFVGSVTTVSMISDKDYSSFRKTTGMIAKIDGSMAAIRVEQNVVAELAYSTANQLTTFVAQTGDNVATIQQELTATATQVYATAVALEQLSIATPEAIAQVTEQVELLAIDQEATILALNQYITQTDGAITLIQEEVEVHSGVLSSHASQLLTLSSAVGDQQADITELYELVNDAGTGLIEANYQLKAQVTDGDRVVLTGMSLGAAIGENGDYRSEIIFMADTIAFLTANGGTLHQPFIFDVVNDTAFLNSVFIKDATITEAKIVDLAVTNTKIGEFISSDDFNGDPDINAPGTLGWFLGRSGANSGKLYLNDVYARGDIRASSLKADAVDIVNTLNLAGDAVLLPRRAEGFTTYYGGNATRELCNVYMPGLLANSSVVIFYNATTYLIDYSVPRFKITRSINGGAEVTVKNIDPYSNFDGQTMDTGMQSVTDSPGQGNVVYRLYYIRGGNFFEARGSLTCFAIKKTA